MPRMLCAALMIESCLMDFCQFSAPFNFREQLIQLLSDEARFREKQYSELEVISQKIRSIPLPSTESVGKLTFFVYAGIVKVGTKKTMHCIVYFFFFGGGKVQVQLGAFTK
jgi:hypothetical protein